MTDKTHYANHREVEKAILEILRPGMRIFSKQDGFCDELGQRVNPIPVPNGLSAIVICQGSEGYHLTPDMLTDIRIALELGEPNVYEIGHYDWGDEEIKLNELIIPFQLYKIGE
jgi:hypothetical protein